jgi:hypothetical protein
MVALLLKYRADPKIPSKVGGEDESILEVASR